MNTVFKDGQEFVDIDGAMLPVYDLHLGEHRHESRLPGCLNCSWHTLKEEEQEKAAASVRAVMDEFIEKHEAANDGHDQEG